MTGRDRPLPAIPDWKVALLANGLVFLFVLLVKIPGEPLLLNELKAIRRRLLLGKLSPVAAAKQIDLVMHGLALRDVLQPYIGRVLKLNNELVAAYGNLINRTTVFIQRYTESKIVSDPLLSDFDKDFWSQIISKEEELTQLFEQVKLKEALKKVMEIKTDNNIFVISFFGVSFIFFFL